MPALMSDLSRKIKEFRQIQRKVKRARLESELKSIRERGCTAQRKEVAKISSRISKRRKTTKSKNQQICNPTQLRWIKLLPVAWKVASFLSDITELARLRSVNLAMYRALSNDMVWLTVLANIDKGLAREVNVEGVEGSLQVCIEKLDDYIRLSLMEFKQLNMRGQALLRSGSFEKAMKYFLQPSAIIKDLESIEQTSQLFKHFLPKYTKYLMARRIFLNHMNASRTYLALENPSQAIAFANESMKYYNKLKVLCESPEEFDNKYAKRHKRLLKIIRRSMKMIPRFFLMQYSPDGYPGLQAGSVLIAVSDLTDDLFFGSKIVITRFEEGSICEGIILNKAFEYAGGQTRLGGPCDLNFKTVLHNSPLMPGSVMVKEGLYLSNQCDQDIDGYIFKEFKGYCSWFAGQLEGELYNGDWELHNEFSSYDILTCNF